MKGNDEIRQLAWQRLWADEWFGRLFGGGLMLGVCGYMAQFVLGGVLSCLGVQTWWDYLLAKAANRVTLTTPVPNLTDDYIFRATSSTALMVFFSYLMAGIAAYGCAVILLRCLKNDDRDWLGAAFGGFRYPFGLLWLMLRYVLVFVGWGLLWLIPVGAFHQFLLPKVGDLSELSLMSSALLSLFFSLSLFGGMLILLIPFYRYRFLFLVKAEHPDWGAGECLRECRKLMDGNKMKSFKLDCSYWRPITLLLLAMLLLPVVATLAAVGVAPLLLSLALFVGLLGILAGAVVLTTYIRVGQGFLYEELRGAVSEEKSGC